MPNGASVSGAAQNSAGGTSLRNVSKFPLSYSFFNTERFGEYTPFFVEEGVGKDKLPFHSSHEVNTYTLKAPLLQSVLKKKDYFAVPMQSILPNNWEKFFTNPVIGQDVPVDCGLGVSAFWNAVESLHKRSKSAFITYLSGTSSTAAVALQRLLTYLVFFEYFYSSGSLMTCLGISGNSFFHVNKGSDASSFDDMFDDFISNIIIANVESFIMNVGGNTYLVSVNFTNSAYNQPYWVISLREALEMIREDLATFSVNSVSFISSSYSSFLTDISQLLSDYLVVPVLNNASNNPVDSDHTIPLNLGRLWAYQLCCAHFYTNDHVDFVFSAELYRQYILQLVTKRGTAPRENLAVFSVNGLDYVYDSLSAYYCTAAFAAFGTNGIYSLNAGSYYFENTNAVIAYFTSLLHYKHSLRYMDYFTGARSLPLAVGDHEVDVNSNNKVDVLDMARGRMMTKFLQAVNRGGRKFGNYMKEIFGVVPAYDYHNPMYLAHTSDVVGSSVNQNTGSEQRSQNAFTSNMLSNSSRYAFTFNADRDCILIGISYYDIPRVYIKAIERQNFVLDRFDMFNPYLQYVGDQSIYRAEIGSRDVSLVPFGYQNHDMQYKQRYNQAAGGFATPSTGLNNWIFVSDSLNRQRVTNISPSFIRSFNSELDHFYTSLTGWSNGTYFHFIVRYDNRQDAVRPMAYAPVIA